MASGLHVPDWLADQMTRKQYVEKREGFSHVERALKELDPKLSLVYVGLRVPHDKCPIGALPGRFHVRRDNHEAGVPDTFMPIVNQHGEYTDPDMGIVENLKKHDLWKKNVAQELSRRWEKEEKARQKKELAFKEDFKQEFAQRVKSKLNPSIAFNTDLSWKAKKGKA